ncbi:hypothetical protein Tco_1530144 [Tanacetum coccineum]
MSSMELNNVLDLSALFLLIKIDFCGLGIEEYGYFSRSPTTVFEFSIYKVWKSVQYGISHGLDTAYWGFLRFSGYGVLIFLLLWSLVSACTDTPYLLDGYGVLVFRNKDVETQGRYGYGINITTAEPVTTASAPITTAGVSVSTAEPRTPPTTTTILIENEYLTIVQTLMKMRSVKLREKLKEKSKEKGVSSETVIRPTRGVFMKEASETITRPIVPPQQQLDPNYKGKGIMQEPKKLVKVKGKDQIAFDEEVARRLEA